MSICILFATFTDRFIKTLRVDSQLQMDDASFQDLKATAAQRARKATRVQVASEHTTRLAKDDSFKRTIATYETNFNITLKQLMDALQIISTTEANHQMANLVMRLDFNDFYKKYFEKNPLPTANVPSSTQKGLGTSTPATISSSSSSSTTTTTAHRPAPRQESNYSNAATSSNTLPSSVYSKRQMMTTNSSYPSNGAPYSTPLNSNSIRNSSSSIPRGESN
jgi:hypothetical protein